MNSTIPILTYHSIDNSDSVVSTSPEKFKNQMKYLAESSFDVISLKDVVTCIRNNKPFPPSSIVITFDDGVRKVYEFAYPILKNYGFKATVFLVTGYCGKSNEWKGQPENIPVLDLLKWDEVMEMANNDIDFCAHSVNHPDLTVLTFDKAYEEIIGSKETIQKYLGKDVSFFAYPYGRKNKIVENIVADNFYGACSSELGLVNFQKSDIYFLPRVDMYYFSRNNLFPFIETFFFPYYIYFRNILRTFRGK